MPRIFSLVFILVFSSSLLAQERSSSSSSMGELLVHDLSLSWKDGVHYFDLSRFDGADWLHAAGALGGTALLMPLDKEGQRFALRQNTSASFNDAMSLFRGYGDPVYSGPAAIAGYFGGLFTGWDDLRITSRQVLQAFLYSGIVTTIAKSIIGRARPYVAKGSQFYLPFKVKNDFNSLPSGHTTIAFALSSVLSERIGNTWASIGLYGVATMTAFSRMYHDQHWLSDVFLGAAIGTFSGIYVVHCDENRAANASESKLLITPSATGVSLTYRF